MSLNQAAFAFIRAYNSLLNIKSQLISEYEHDVARHHFIKPVLTSSIQRIQIDYPSLSFMLRLDPNLVMSISLIESDVNGTIDVIWERSKIHHDYLQPAVEQIQRSGKKNITTDGVDDALGPRVATELKLATDYMIAGVDRGIESTKDIVQRLRNAGKEKYPDEKFVCIT